MSDDNDEAGAGSMQDLLDNVLKAIQNLTTLEIETSIDGDAKKRRMLTVIDLIQGDIRNSIHQDFITGDLSELRAFHESQVAKGQEIIKANIAAVTSIYELIVNNGLDSKQS